MSTTRIHEITVTGGTVHVVDSSPGHHHEGPPVVFLHGWPQDHTAWEAVVDVASSTHRCLALDLPGIGRSRLDVARGDTSHLARLIDETLAALSLDSVDVVGHDAGGMVAFALLRRHARVRRAVIMDTAVPGVAPWDDVVANPFIWHFAFHAVPALPEILVSGHEADYLDVFFEAITARPERITATARARYAATYADPASLTQGFELYRAFPVDVHDNREKVVLDTPLLYLRGSAEGGDLETYAAGFRASGLNDVTTARVGGAGHFAPEEAPDEVWALVAEHLRRPPR